MVLNFAKFRNVYFVLLNCQSAKEQLCTLCTYLINSVVQLI